MMATTIWVLTGRIPTAMSTSVSAASASIAVPPMAFTRIALFSFAVSFTRSRLPGLPS